MIKTKKGKTEFRGNRSEFSADFMSIVKSYATILENKAGLSREEAIEQIKEEEWV